MRKMNLLIPYVPLFSHPDPLFEEFTYGDGKTRGKKLRKLTEGSHVFFHTKLRGKKYITAYYVVHQVLPTAVVAKHPYLSKFANPHIGRHKREKEELENDTILFGYPIASGILRRPLPFTRQLAEKLSLNIKFTKGRSETQCIGSATRNWRELENEDVDVLLREIECLENGSGELGTEELLSAEEVAEFLERDIENYIVRNPSLFGNNLKLVRRQERVPGGRTDLVLQDAKGNLLVIELKLNLIGHRALDQIGRYIEEVRKETGKDVSGVIICKGVMPAFQEEFKKLKRDIRIFCYGWQLKIQPWEEVFE